jgi:hypothetical protein
VRRDVICSTREDGKVLLAALDGKFGDGNLSFCDQSFDLISLGRDSSCSAQPALGPCGTFHRFSGPLVNVARPPADVVPYLVARFNAPWTCPCKSTRDLCRARIWNDKRHE